jgi:peptidoglycan/LPS O-acetylase OafA/YrhL
MNGHYGVNLFFVISGFVIARTLENCVSFGLFMKKRFVRLMPCLLLCSLVTFFLEEWAYHDFSFLRTKTYLNFLPSLSFLSGSFWNSALGRHDITYIDGAYWTLSVEMVFYVMAGIVFFLETRMFFLNWIRLTVVLSGIRIIASPKIRFLFPNPMKQVLDTVYDTYLNWHLSYWIYFALGIFFYRLFSVRKKPPVESLVWICALTVCELYFLKDNALRLAFVIVLSLFLIFIYRKKWLGFLTFTPLLWLGLISYPLYLLHEDIGLILMNRIATLLQVPSLNKYMPLFALFILLIAAGIIHRFFEVPILAFLKRRMQLLNTNANK